MNAVAHLPVKWVRKDKYCELTGDKAESVKRRKATGMWAEGVHYKMVGKKEMWVNLEAVNQWVETKPILPPGESA